ncbi:MAG TPA: NADPH-dependent 7-cyano-7-deazaguanine reductase QueF [Casimicrobiaceae bacterium]|nr:NADPH-dependent 7-cyano-7-deazaguanine reductase QueF [Casimicrobiaceae bacterium]
MTRPTDGSPLGQPTTYPDRYDPSQLFSIDRSPGREALGIHGELPFSGVDLWTAHEITWLDREGKPQVAVGEFRVGADSPSIVESKSLKLYLGSFAQERVDTAADLGDTIRRDLARACGTSVSVALSPVAADAGIVELPGESLDAISTTIDTYVRAPELLASRTGDVEETLRSALFRSNCPVTGQPDYADVMIHYRGNRIDHEALLRYLVSYRLHAAFHESCVEQIFVDIAERCRPECLTVYARFLRRGGLDINPFRSNFERPPMHDQRTPRQ